MEMFFGVFVMAISIEGIIEYIKMIKNKEMAVWVLLSLAISLIACIGYNLDIYALFGMKSTIPYLGIALTSVAVSRGTNYISDLIKKINASINK